VGAGAAEHPLSIATIATTAPQRFTGYFA